MLLVSSNPVGGVDAYQSSVSRANMVAELLTIAIPACVKEDLVDLVGLGVDCEMEYRM